MSEFVCPKCKKSINSWVHKDGWVFGECSCGQETGVALFEMLSKSKAERDDLRKLLSASKNGLLSYKYGNSSPDLAEIIITKIEKLEAKYD